MKKADIYKFLYGICALCAVAFAVRLGADWFKYDGINNSAPFYAFVAIRVAEYILPGALAFVAAKTVKKKYTK